MKCKTLCSKRIYTSGATARSSRAAGKTLSKATPATRLNESITRSE